MKLPAEFVLVRVAKALAFIPVKGSAELLASIGPEKASALKRAIDAALVGAKEPIVLHEYHDLFAGMTSSLPKHKTPLGAVADEIYFALKRHCPPCSFNLAVVDSLDVEEVAADWDGHLLEAFAKTVAATRGVQS